MSGRCVDLLARLVAEGSIKQVSMAHLDAPDAEMQQSCSRSCGCMLLRAEVVMLKQGRCKVPELTLRHAPMLAGLWVSQMTTTDTRP